MICNFMTTFPKGSGKLTKKATFFVEKIWQSFPSDFTIERFDINRFRNQYNFSIDAIDFIAKKHTIRQDLSNRWKVGMMIDFFINARTKKAFRFAPRVPVISLQTIKISRTDHLSLNCYPGQMWIQNIFIGGIPFKRAFMVQIDGAIINHSTLKELAINDGFDSVDDFFNWFCDDFEGKIIHWTDLKY